MEVGRFDFGTPAVGYPDWLKGGPDAGGFEFLDFAAVGTRDLRLGDTDGFDDLWGPVAAMSKIEATDETSSVTTSFILFMEDDFLVASIDGFPVQSWDGGLGFLDGLIAVADVGFDDLWFATSKSLTSFAARQPDRARKKMMKAAQNFIVGC